MNIVRYISQRRTVLTVVIAGGIIFAPGVFAQTSFNKTTFLSGLNSPTAMEFSPDGRLFIAEKGGNLRVVKNSQLLSTPFLSVQVESSGERGLLGVAFDPNFAVNRLVYVYYTRSVSPTNRVSRFLASPTNPDIAESGSERVLLDDISGSDCCNHNGGAIHFGPDGKLYIAVGDGANNSSKAQSLGSLQGKLLRINADGTIPASNPFVGSVGAREEIWALGLRNPFTFAFESGTGKSYINDVGQNTWEEINLGGRGANYGWPTCEGTCADARFQDPLFAYSHTGGGAAITGGVFYRATQFPSEYTGAYFFGDYVKNWVKQFKPDIMVADFAADLSGPVDLKVGPDGGLYVLEINSGKVSKFLFSGASNRLPVAVAIANPTAGLMPLAVAFDGSQSSDPDGDALNYSWNFGDGSPTESGVSVNHTFTASGRYVAGLSVDDGKGGTGMMSITIFVGNAPIATIAAPVPGTLYTAGDTVSYAGNATDPEDGALPANAFSWLMVFHHNVHTHPFLGPITGQKTGVFQIPRVGEPSIDAWYRMHLTVTDSSRLTSEVTRDIKPRTSKITLVTAPTGLLLTLDGQPSTATFSVSSVVGFTRTIGASLQQVLGGKIYEFISWSDGQPSEHVITIPTADTIYTATFQEKTSFPSSSPSPGSSTCTQNPGYASNCIGGIPVFTASVPQISATTYSLSLSLNLPPSPPSLINAIWNKGYYWAANKLNPQTNQNGLWLAYTLQGPVYPNTTCANPQNGCWLQNTANASLSIPKQDLSTPTNYFVLWDYTWTGQCWKGPEGTCPPPTGKWRAVGV